MRNLFSLALLLNLGWALIGCEALFPPEKERPKPKRIEEVIKCNKFGTCLVRFESGERGLMTRPSAGEYGCQSISSYSFNRCPGPDEKADD